ncbi:MAG: hypothetical protein ABIG84_02320 [archaeon]
MLFGIICETDDKKEHRLIFTSDVSALHFKAGTTFSKEDFKDMLEHIDADCKMFRGNARTSHCTENIAPKEKTGPRFILFRHLEKKKRETEVKVNRIDLNEINKKNETLIKEMLDSEWNSVRIVQSYSLSTSDSVEEFYGKKDEKLPKKEDEGKNTIAETKKSNAVGNGIDKTAPDFGGAMKKIYDKLKTVNRRN